MLTVRLWILLALALVALPALAEVRSTQVPAVEKTLRRRYGLPPQAVPAAPAQGLEGLVEILRRRYPWAEVSSGFYDWRGVSIYRSQPGLHLGYDIAMPAGTAVGAGWPGEVVAIVPWVEGQWGITVASPGFEVTYGHLVPAVEVGQSVQPGDVLGTVAVDHVDVKMRDAAGNYVDFGRGARGVVSRWSPPAGSREELMVGWLVARNGYELARDELERKTRQRASFKAERARLQQKVRELEAAVPQMASYVEQGLVSRKSAEETRQELEEARQRLTQLEKGASQQSLDSLSHQVHLARQRLAVAEQAARARGITWSDVTAFVNQTVARDPLLRAQVIDYKKQAVRRRAELQQKVKEGRQHLQALEDLYKMGGVSRLELESARARQRVLEAELQALGD
jgi:hypothetical protein